MQYSSDIKVSSSDALITINNCGEQHFTKDSHIRRYAGRNDYQLIYICEGNCVVTLGGEIRIAKPGDCILYRPGEAQDYLLAQKVKPHTYFIHFNGSLCQKLFRALSLEDVHIVEAGQNRDVEHSVAKICRCYNMQTPNWEWICSGLLQSVLALLSNEVHTVALSENKGCPDRISELICHIKGVSNLNITVSECAVFCCMSKAHFTRVFKQTTGRSPVQFMLDIRIERAKELLDFTDMPIAEIAEASGFYDQNYFARTFKKITGMSPTQYRHADKTKLM